MGNNIYVASHTSTPVFNGSVVVKELESIKEQVDACNKKLEDQRAKGKRLGVPDSDIEPCVFCLDHVRSDPYKLTAHVRRLWPNTSISIREYNEQIEIDSISEDTLVDQITRNIAEIKVFLPN